MESLHVQLKIKEAVDSRRNLLSTQINLLNIIKQIQEYQKLRKLELKSKQVLRAELRKLISDIKTLIKELPKTKPVKKDEREVREEILEKTTRSKLERELKEIKEKLERLS